MIDQVQRRLLVALGASVLLHGWLAQTGEPGARRAAAAGAPLQATLNTAPHLPVQAFEPYTAPVPDAPRAAREASVAAQSPRVALTAPAAVAPDHPVAQAALRNNAESTAVPASDPTYYTARSLDVYPRALTALDLGLQPGAGKVRATVLIDESGTVNEVRAIEADAADIEYAARDLLLRTRFSPASKDGRMVKAQLLVSLDAATDAGRR